MRKEDRKHALAAAAAVVFLCALFAIVFLGGQKDIPENMIPSPAQTFTSQTMYVAPGDSGQSKGGDAGESSDETTLSNMQRQQNPSDQRNEQSSGDGTSPGELDPDRPGPVIPGIFTDLGNFNLISSDTPAPNPMSINRSGWSGLDRTSKLLYFYAIPSEEGRGYSVLVEYANDTTGWGMATLSGRDGRFGLPIVLSDGAYSDVRLTLVDSNGARTNRVAQYRVTYQGHRGPLVTLSIDDGQRFSSSPVTLLVTARDAYDDTRIYPEHISVTVQGAGQTYTLTPQGASEPYAYILNLENYQLEGDDTEFFITVTAWDYTVEQATTTETRRIVYEHHPYGAVIGQATVIIDATPVGLGIVTSFTIDLHQGFPFPKDLAEGLENHGIGTMYTGSFSSSFYLSGLQSGGLFVGQRVPDTLMHKIEQDKITFTGAHNADALTDSDYTASSGWLYVVNGGWWPSYSLDAFTPSPGDTIYLVYTIAGGMDTGGGGAGTGGALSSYCGTWRNGTYSEQHDLSDYQVMEEPTCVSEGRARYVCSVYGCGAWGSQTGQHADGVEIILPATGAHDWVFDPLNSEEPADGVDGVRAYVCSVCGEVKYDVWPWEGGGDEPGPEPGPSPDDGSQG